MKKIILLTLAILLSGCAGTQFNWDDARKIKSGTTIEEVTQIMGNPYLAVASNGTMRYTWSYATAFSGARAVAVVFKDGKVMEAPPIPENYK